MKDNTLVKQMRIFKTLLIVTLLSFFADTTGYSQTLQSDGYQISFKSFEKREMSFCGKKKIIYSGIIKVKSKDSLKGKYVFFFPIVDEKINVLTIKDLQKKVLEPKLYFDEERKIFINEGKESLGDDKSIEEIVLSGMLIWLKINK